jgi:hypothetical protein
LIFWVIFCIYLKCFIWFIRSFFSQSRIRFARFYIKKGLFKYKGVPATFSIHSWSPRKEGSKQH